MIFLDSEGCGFHGFMVLLQYAQDDNEVKMWHIWKEPISETLELLEWIANQEVCMFNAAFDWFHISKVYTTFTLLLDSLGPDAIPENHIDEVAIAEEKARFLDICIKPKGTIDLMLHARKGPYQSLMARRNILVKRIPALLCEAVRLELEKNIELDGIYFAKRKNPDATQWQIRDAIDKDGELDPNFRNIVLSFNSSHALKELAKHALKIKEDLILKFTDIEPNPYWRPKELGYAPFALAIGKPGVWNKAWPEVIRHYISHWYYNSLAKKYAQDDVIITRNLYYFFGSPLTGDDDSELACAIGAARWRGFNIDIDKLEERRRVILKRKGKVPTAPKQARIYIEQVMDETEKIALNEGTGAVILESIAGKEDTNWEDAWVTEDGKIHPAAVRAREVLQARRDDKEVELYNKLLLAGHFHASFKIIGTLSSRMSGADKLNPQGIKAKKEVRSCFPLADFDNGFVLCGGDFASFEIVLMIAAYDDKKLEADVKSGKSVFGLFGASLMGVDYDTIMSTKGTTGLYTKSKGGVYSQAYGGTEHTLMDRLGISEEKAKEGTLAWEEKYPGVRAAKKDIFDKFCSMRQPSGIGSEVIWHEPADKIESLFGFPRYFTLENKICKALFDLAQNPPKSWKNVRIKVKRRDRLQTASGACQSALYAAAFQIQASSMRAALNHRIQSSGAQITKRLQRNIWNIQPYGVGPWIAQVMNVHDEVHTVTRSQYIKQITKVAEETVKSYRERVPLIKLDWNETERTWADK